MEEEEIWTDEENQEAYWIRKENQLLKLEKEKLEKEVEIENHKIKMIEAAIEETMINFWEVQEQHLEEIETDPEEEEPWEPWEPIIMGYQDEPGVGSKRCEKMDESCEKRPEKIRKIQ